MEKRKIAIIVYDGKKTEMVAFLNQNKVLLRHFNLIVTGTTSNYVKKSGFIEKNYKSNLLDEDVRISRLMSEGKIAMVFFFIDPLCENSHEPDVQMLMRLCDEHNIPLATNPATANYLIKSLVHVKQRDIQLASSTFLTKSEKKVLIGGL